MLRRLLASTRSGVVKTFRCRTQILGDSNPYQSPVHVDGGAAKPRRMFLLVIFSVLTAYTIYTAIPAALRAVQLFSAGDLMINMQRCGACLCLLLAAVSLGVAAHSCRSGRWQRIAISATFAIALTAVGRYLLHAYAL